MMYYSLHELFWRVTCLAGGVRPTLFLFVSLQIGISKSAMSMVAQSWEGTMQSVLSFDLSHSSNMFS